MVDVQAIANRYVTSWNEADPARRQALIEGLWSQNARYTDPVMQAEGQDGIGSLVAGVQAQFPGFRFALSGRADGHGRYVRFSWHLGPVDGQPVARGTDIAEVAADGRLAQVVGFLDQVPGAA